MAMVQKVPEQELRERYFSKMLKSNAFPLPEYSVIIVEILYLDRSSPNNNNVDVSHFMIIELLITLLFTYDRLREEKMREKQRHQEERLKAALERAVAQPKKKVCLLHNRPLSQSHMRTVLLERPCPSEPPMTAEYGVSLMHMPKSQTLHL